MNFDPADPAERADASASGPFTFSRRGGIAHDATQMDTTPSADETPAPPVQPAHSGQTPNRRPAVATPVTPFTLPFDASGEAGPDLSFLDPAIAPMTAFPLDALPEAMRDLITAMGEGQSTHPAFLATCVLATVAGAVGTSAHLKVTAGWREPCGIWILLVGSSGTGKSVAMRSTVGVLTALGIAAISAAAPDPGREAVARMVHGEAARQIRRRIREGLERDETDFSSYTLPQTAASAPALNTCTSLTLPGILDKLQAQPRGLLLAQPDIVGLVRGATLRSDEGRAALLQGYDGDAYIRDRATGPQILASLLLSLCGGVQPDKLAAVVGREDDGLYARCLVSFPVIVRATEMPARNAAATDRFAEVLRHVLAMPAAASAFAGHPVMLTEHAWRALDAASRRWAAEAAATTGMLASTFNRSPTQALRLALVLAILEHALAGKAGYPSSVSEACARTAIRLLDAHYLPSAERALDAAQARPDPDVDLRAIARFIAQNAEGHGFNVRELRQARRAPCYRDRAAWTKAIDRLVRLGCVREAPRGNATGRGRADYHAHPSFLAAARGMP